MIPKPNTGLDYCGRLNNGPQDVHILIPEPVNIASYGKKDFVNVIKLKILRWGNYPGLFVWTLNLVLCALIRGTEDLTTEEKAIWKQKQDTMLLALKMEEETMSQGL